jgi:hypothetical protein
MRGERREFHVHPHMERQCGEDTLQFLLIVSTPSSNRAPLTWLDWGLPESKQMTLCCEFLRTNGLPRLRVLHLGI